MIILFYLESSMIGQLMNFNAQDMQSRTSRCFWSCLAAVICAAAVTVTGCETSPKVPPVVIDAKGNALYEKVRKAHNERVGSLTRFWARSIVEARWTEEGGRKRFEQGDGHLILSFPDKSALTIGKLGDVKYWAGANGKQYWLYDELNGKLLHVGRTDAASSAGANALRRSPLLVKPSDMPYLIGVLPLPRLPLDPKKTYAKQVDSQIEVIVPDQPLRITFDAATMRPTQITLLDHEEKTLLTATLSRYERMEKENAAIGPYVAHTIDLKLVEGGSRLTVYLSDPTDLERRVKDKLFDLEFLSKMLKPARIVDLDKPRQAHP